MRTSIIVLTYNREEGLERVLQAITRQTYRPSEVLVVDNGSMNPCASLVEQFLKVLPVRYIRIGKSSIGKARNVGISEASGDVVFFTDDDCIPERDWMQRLSEVFSRKPEVVAAGGPLKSYGEPYTLIDTFCDVEFSNVSKWWETCSEDFDLPYHLQPFFMTANAAFRKEALLSVGLFDEFLPVGEDVNICARLRQAGALLEYAEKAIVYHENRKSVSALLWQRFWYGRIRAALYLKESVHNEGVLIVKKMKDRSISRTSMPFFVAGIIHVRRYTGVFMLLMLFLLSLLIVLDMGWIVDGALCVCILGLVWYVVRAYPAPPPHPFMGVFLRQFAGIAWMLGLLVGSVENRVLCVE